MKRARAPRADAIGPEKALRQATLAFLRGGLTLKGTEMREFLVVSIMALIIAGGITIVTVLSSGDPHRIQIASF